MFSANVFAKKSEQQIISDIQKSFYTCVAKEYSKNGSDLNKANKICIMSYNIAFENQNTQFEIIRGRSDGPKTFFIEFKITRAKKVRTFQYFHGKDDVHWACPVVTDKSSSAIQKLTENVTSCDDPEKSSNLEEASNPEESQIRSTYYSLATRYGYGFYPNGKGCTRICPKNETLQNDKCISCRDSASAKERFSAVGDFSVSLFEKYTHTDNFTNECLNEQGCSVGQAFVRKNPDGSSVCTDMDCGKRGFFYVPKEGCSSDPAYCKTAAAIMQKGLSWLPDSAFPKKKISKCSYQEVLATYKEYQSRVMSKIVAFEDLCRQKIKVGKYATLPDSIPFFKEYLREKCSASYNDIEQIPSAPQFNSAEAANYFYLLVD